MPNHHRKHLPSNIKPLVSAIATCLALSAIPSQAATITVMNHSDSGTGSLRQAILDTNTGNVADTIDFDAGLDGLIITLSSGQMDITDGAPLIIDASALTNGITINGNNLSRIFGVTQTQKLTLNNLTVTLGKTTADYYYGGLACAASASATFTRGGAICAKGDLELIGSTVSNSSTAGSGAHGGGFYAIGNVTLTNSTISGNSTAGDGARGGGFSTYLTTTLTNSTVSGNSTAGSDAYGGGFLAYLATTLTNSTVSWNSTTGHFSSGGGGRTFFGPLTLTNSTVSDNSTAGSSAPGGGIYGGILSISNMILTNSTVSGNSTAGSNSHGGGIIFSNITSNNSTITQNTASSNNADGDGIFGTGYAGVATLNSTILSGNGVDNFAVDGGTTTTLSATHSLLGDAPSEIDGTNTANVFNNTPELTALADNGCTSPAGTPAIAACIQTHALLGGSPALNVGLDNGLLTDQRGAGFPRTINGFTDIGAFEGLAPDPDLDLDLDPAPPTPIPTISAWGLGFLASLLGLMGFVRRRKA